MATIISQQVKFQDVTPDDFDKIKTADMLEASTGITCIIEKMGKQFSHSKDDMLGNISKIKKVYDTDPAKFELFHTLLETEKANGTYKKDSSASVGGLWLKRGLEFTCEFFYEIVKEHENCKKPYPEKDTCHRDLVKTAYKKTLTNHHGMPTRMLFNAAAYMCPYKDQFLLEMALKQPGMDDQVITDMKVYEALLREFSVNMANLFKQYGDKGPFILSAKDLSMGLQQKLN